MTSPSGGTPPSLIQFGLCAVGSNTLPQQPWGVYDGSVPAGASNINSLAIAPGTWVVIGMVISANSWITPYLNTASGVASDSWPTLEVGGGTAVPLKAAVVTFSAVTTVYLNVNNASAATLVQSQIYIVRVE